MGFVLDTLQLINNIKLPVGNYGYMRSQMPQIDSKQFENFKSWLKEKEVLFFNKKIPIQRIRLAQNEINKTKVFKLMQKFRKQKMQKPILVSNNGSHYFVIDGSHRFVAHLNMGDKKFDKINCIVIDLPIQDCIKLINTFPGVKHRSVSGKNIDE